MGDYQPFRRLSGNPSDIALMYADQDIYERGLPRSRPKLGNTGAGMRSFGSKPGRPERDAFRKQDGNPHRDRQKSRAKQDVLRLVCNLAAKVSPDGSAKTQTIVELELMRTLMIQNGVTKGAAWKRLNEAMQLIEKGLARAVLA